MDMRYEKKSPLFFEGTQWAEGKKSNATSSEMITRQLDAVKDLKGGNK